MFVISDEEYRTFVGQKHVFAAYQTILILHYNMREAFLSMAEHADSIIVNLEALLVNE